MASAGMLGVIVLAMYGDRTPFYQDPYTYHQSYTKLTPLGQVRVLNPTMFTEIANKC